MGGSIREGYQVTPAPVLLSARAQQLSAAMAMLNTVMRKPYSDADLAAVMLTLIDIRDGIEELAAAWPPS